MINPTPSGIEALPAVGSSSAAKQVPTPKAGRGFPFRIIRTAELQRLKERDAHATEADAAREKLELNLKTAMSQGAHASRFLVATILHLGRNGYRFSKTDLDRADGHTILVETIKDTGEIKLHVKRSTGK